MNIKQIEVPMPWGFLRGQIFGECSENSTPILALHGYLDNSNSFKPLAEYLCQSGSYHIIAIDLPGHGLSDKVSNGMLYTIKAFIFCIRKVATFLNLKRHFILAHSFGCTLSTLYTACYPEDVVQLLFIDFAFDFSVTCEDPIVCWKECVDKYVKAFSSEVTGAGSESPNRNRKDLTQDLAVEILLKANKNLDKNAARTLLERGLTQRADGKLDFSRDVGVNEFLPIRFHYSEFKSIREHMVGKIKCPILDIYAYPYPYGEMSNEAVVSTLEAIEREAKVNVQLKRFDGTHHFHMIEPKATSEIILSYLNGSKH